MVDVDHGWKSRARTLPSTMPRADLPVPALDDLLHLPPNDLARVDVAVVNMLCATGLPGAEDLNIRQCLATLDRWADAVRRFVRDGMGDYQRNPEQYHRHKGFYCFLSMVTLLKHPRGLGVRYQPTAIGNYAMADSRDDLLHGLLTRRLGTCASLPVLFVAIGRRLGYPMCLAVAKGHVLCQWLNEDGTWVNLEGSCGGGGEMPPIEHYHTWPRPMTKGDLASGNYLRPLTPSEEFALFLEIRGHCLVDNRRFDEARAAYAYAHRFAPHWTQYDNHLYSLELHERAASGQTQGEIMLLSPQPWHPTINASIPNRALFPTLLGIPGIVK